MLDSDSDDSDSDADGWQDAEDGLLEVDDGGVLQILSKANRRFLKSLENVDLLVCPYQTVTPTPQDRKLWLSCFDTVDALDKDGDRWLALKLHYLMVRLVCYPSIDAKEKAMSYRQLFKKRVKRFKTGKWQEIWQDQKKVKVGGERIEEIRKEDEGKLDIKTKKRARELANQLELSKARKALLGQKLADPTDPEVFQTLQELHNPKTPLLDFPLEPDHYRDDHKYVFEVGTVEVPGPRDTPYKIKSDHAVLKKLKKKVAQAGSGTRYEHYMGLEESHPDLIHGWITRIANDDLKDSDAEDFIRCAKLFAFYKDKDMNKKKLRPCAIGDTLRRITAKVMVLQENPSLQEKFLRVRQLGVGTKGGLEMAYHATRLHLDAIIDGEQNEPNCAKSMKGMMQADFTNAFNSTCRSEMFHSIEKNAPQFLRFYILCYSDYRGKMCDTTGFKGPPLMLIWAGNCQNIVQASFGTQQGDPLGCHCYAWATMDFAQDLMDEVPDCWIVWYVDDLAVSGSLEDFGKIATFIKRRGPRYGLFLSPKPELSHVPVAVDDDHDVFVLQSSVAEDSDSQATTLSTQNVRLPDRSSSAVDSSKVKNWIYLKQKETQAQYTKEQTYNELLQEDEDLADLTDFAVTSAGLQRFLGAPLGDQDFESHHAEKIMEKLLKGIENLRYIDRAQLEFFILKHCDATKATHLTRLLPPRSAQNALKVFETKIRAELDRIQGGPKMPQRAWEQAKQPTRTLGMGLQDVTLTAPSNYAAALGDVARLNNALKENFTQEDHMGPVNIIAAQILVDQELAQIVNELRERTEDTTTNKLCLKIEEIQDFPTQKTMSRAVYDNKAEQLIKEAGAGAPDAQTRLRCKNWLVSQSQVGAGAQFKALPGPEKFKIEDTTFRIMIQQFLMITIPDLPKKCQCGADMDRWGLHWIDCMQCETGNGRDVQKSWHYQRHNDLRDAHIKICKKYLGLTLSTKSQNAIQGQPYLMPGDSIANAEFFDTQKDQYFDYTLVNPAGPSNSKHNPQAVPLKTTQTAEVRKMKEFADALFAKQVHIDDAPFEKKPLAFEITGAMGKGMKEHVKQMLRKYLGRFTEGSLVPTLQQQGDEDHTWTANSFTPMLQQTLAVNITRGVAQMIKTRRRDAKSDRPARPQARRSLHMSQH